MHGDGDITRRADADRHGGAGVRETRSLYAHTIGGRRKITEAEFTAVVTLRPAFHGRFAGLEDNRSRWDSRTARVFDRADQTAVKILGTAEKSREGEGENQGEMKFGCAVKAHGCECYRLAKWGGYYHRS